MKLPYPRRDSRRPAFSTAVQSSAKGAPGSVGLSARASNLATAFLVILVSGAEAAAPPTAQPPKSSAAKEATYIVDVTGERVRIVGPGFYPNPAKGLIFPGRNLNSQHQPKL